METELLITYTRTHTRSRLFTDPPATLEFTALVMPDEQPRASKRTKTEDFRGMVLVPPMAYHGTPWGVPWYDMGCILATPVATATALYRNLTPCHGTRQVSLK